MVRLAHTHLRFGTFERLLYLREPQALERLLRHVVTVYYPQIAAAHLEGPRGNVEPALLAPSTASRRCCCRGPSWRAGWASMPCP